MSGTFGRDTDSVPYWEREAARYHDHVGGSRTAYHDGRLRTADRLLERAALPAGARVVDFGCGDGVYARRLAAAGFDVVGLDPAGAMIDLRAREDAEAGRLTRRRRRRAAGRRPVRRARRPERARLHDRRGDGRRSGAR